MSPKRGLTAQSGPLALTSSIPLPMRLTLPRATITLALTFALMGGGKEVAAQSRDLGWGSLGSERLLDQGTVGLGGVTSPWGGDRYLYGTMALGLPSALVSAMNLRGDTQGRVWLGLAGIGLGVGHGALFVAGLREDDAPSGTAVWWNALASTYSTFSGILQIRSTIGDGPQSSSLKASVTPRVDGLRLNVLWRR